MVGKAGAASDLSPDKDLKLTKAKSEQEKEIEDFEDNFFSGGVLRQQSMKLTNAQDFEGQLISDQFQIQMTFDSDP